VKRCHREGLSKKSAGKLIDAVEKPENLAKAVVELAAVVDAGTPLIKNCYNCESKQPMVFVVGEIIDAMNRDYGLGVGGYTKFDELGKQSRVAAEIMGKAVASHTKEVDDCKVALDTAKEVKATAEASLTSFEAEHNIATANRARRPATANRQNYATMANPASRLTAQAQQHKVLKDAFDSAVSDVEAKELLHNSAVEKLSKFKEGKLITEADFRDHGIKVVTPIFDDYRRLFLTPTGDYFKISAAYHAARVLNPLIAAEMSNVQVEEAVRQLKEFGFDEFRDGGGIIDEIVKEIPNYLARVRSTGVQFWNSVEGADEYDVKLAAKAVEEPEKYQNFTWKSDPIEKARRIWEWWRVNHNHPGMFHFAQAARLVALVQVSSASVERVFSQVKLICETTGVSPLEQNLQIRLFERCNVYPSDI